MKKVKRFFTSSRGRAILGVIFVVLFLAMFVTTVALATASRPTRSTTSSGYELFRNASPFSANFVIDKPRTWIPVSGGSEVTATGIVGLGGGTPVPTECNTSEIGGFLLNANAESVSAMIPVPEGIDLSQDIRLRALYSNSAGAGTGTCLITFTYEPFVTGTTAIVVADDACDTDGAAAADLAANVLTWTNWSTIDGGTITLTPGDDFMTVKGAVTLVTIVDATLYGYQMEWSRKFMGGGGSY